MKNFAGLGTLPSKVLYTGADYAWYLALPRTTVAEGTVLFNCQSVFAYGLSVAVLGEALVLRKGAAVLVSRQTPQPTTDWE